MKVILINSTDKGGGAAIACLRLAKALISSGINCKVLVQKQKGDSKSWLHKCINNYFQKLKYFIRIKVEESQVRKYNIEKSHNFSPGSFGININNKEFIRNSDILHLHWINDAFLSIENIGNLSELNKPIVWTLHDMWPLTGGCHYSEGCEKFCTHCNSCPVLGSDDEHDLSWEIWEKKNTYLKNKNIIIITPSNWLAGLAKSSSLFRNNKIYVIPNAINTDIYKPINKKIARENHQINNEKFIILFGAVNAVEDERKGFKFLLEAIEIISSDVPKDEIIICIYGTDSIQENINFLYPIKILGKLNNDDALVNAYNAADIFLLPSLQDNLPNTVMESLSCGTPVVAFNIGGIPDMVIHEKSGYLAEPRSSQELAKGILWFYQRRQQLKQYSDFARNFALKNYSSEIISKQHIDLYSDLLTINKVI